MRRILWISLLVILLYFSVGLFAYPYWWYQLLREGGYRTWETWSEGISYVFLNFGPGLLFALITIWAILVCQGTAIPEKLRATSDRFWHRYILGRRALLLIVLLIACSALGLITLKARSQQGLQLEASMKELQQNVAEGKALTEQWKTQREKLPLSTPTTFLFLDKQAVDSLYGQYAPELTRARIIEEIKESEELEAGLTIEGYLNTRAGKQTYQSRLEEYRAVPKSPERELKELLTYLNQKNVLERFGNIEFGSDELKNLDQATGLLTSKYGIVVNQEKLKVLRGRLLAAVLANLDERLRSLRGLVLVEGDWTVEIHPDAYLLKRAFLANVSHPALCEVKLRRESISANQQDIIQNLSGKEMRLAVFGNVLAGISDNSRAVLLNPVAVF
jgi:hypothetical protein